MGSEQSKSAPASLVRRLGRWARGDRYMIGAYSPEWQERAASDGPVVAVEPPTDAVTATAAAIDDHAAADRASVAVPVTVAG